MTTKAVEKRNFCFVLSPTEGNKVAARMGFPKSSEDVAECESRDAKVKIGLLLGTGVYPHIHEVGSWMTEIYRTAHPNLTDEEKTDAEQIFTAYGCALVTHLLDKGILVFGEECFEEATKE